MSNPGKISCGAATAVCDAGTENCCWPDYDAGAGKCAPTDTCQNGPGGDVYSVRCDERADCETGNLCCLGFGETICTDDCGNGQGIQVCKTNAECVNDAGCALGTCSLGDP